MILKAVNISKSYPTGDGPLSVLRDINLSLDNGELVSVMGPSGCGKSTLLNILGTLDEPDSGELWIDGNDVSTLTDVGLSQIRSKTIGFVFQFHHLLPEFTVIENLIIPQLMCGTNHEDAFKKGIDLLEKVDLLARKDHKPIAISGGERQRVAVLRALVNNPGIVLADEPTGNLDFETSQVVLEMIKDLVHEKGQAFLIVTHNPEIAATCKRNLTLMDGVITETSEN